MSLDATSELDRYGRTQLHIAAENNDLKRMDILLESQNFDVNAVDHSGRTALHCLLDKNAFEDLEEVKRGIILLKQQGADINTQDHILRTPLHLVFEIYLELIPDIITFLLEMFPSYNHCLKNNDGYTIFHIFMSNIQTEEKEDKDEVLRNRERFVHSFIKGNTVNISKEEIKHLINDKNSSGYSAFQTYVDGDCYCIDTVKLMIQHGAYVNNSSNLGITALMQSTIRNREDTVDVLLQAGADPNAIDIFGQTALFRVRSETFFHLLCDYGARIDVRDRFGKSPVTNYSFFIPEDLPLGAMAIESDLSQFRPLAELFLVRGVSPDIQDNYGSTLLLYAAWWSDERLIQFLLDHNANRNIRDNKGMTPFDLALYHGNYNITNLLNIEKQQGVSCKATKCQEETRKYSRIVIQSKETEKMEDVFTLLGIQDTPCELIELMLESPMLGLTNRKMDAEDVKTTVNNLMQKTAAIVSEMDFRFRVTIKPTGSSSEGTMIGDPCEFDFVFCLDYFAEECEVIQPDELLNTGFAYLSVAKYVDNHPLTSFISNNGFICVGDVRHTFQDHVVKALNDQNLWNDEHIYFDGLVEFPDDKPIMKLKLQWYGSIYKQIVVSVDMVPAILKQEWFPYEIDQDKLTLLNDHVKKAGFFLLFHCPHESKENNYDNYVRISSAAMEIAFFQKSPAILRECYAVCKILKNLLFCPCIQFDDSEMDINTEQTDGSQTSYFRYSRKTEDSEKDICTKDIDGSQISSFRYSKQTEDNSCGVKCIKDTNLIVHCVSDWLMQLDADTRTIKKMYTPKNETNVDDNPDKPTTDYAETIAEEQFTEYSESRKNKQVTQAIETKADIEVIYSRCKLKENPLTECNRAEISTYNANAIWKDIALDKAGMSIADHTANNKDDDHDDCENSTEALQTCTNSSNVNDIDIPLKSVNVIDTDEDDKNKEKNEGDINNDIYTDRKREVGKTDEYDKSAQRRIKDSVEANKDEIDSKMEEGNIDEADEDEQDTEVAEVDIIEADTYNDSESEEMIVLEADDTEWEGGDVVEADEYITSYMLKNCLLHVLSGIHNTGSDVEITHLELAIRVYEYLLECTERRSLHAYCMPFVNIFSYVNEHIRSVPLEELEEEIVRLCDRIKCFCKVILGILRQPANPKP